MLFLTPAVLVFQKTFYTIAGLFGIGFLIGFHELGHFLFCKLFGIRTPSFSIGFGPVIFSRTFGETKFKLSAIPLGGYVEIAGSAEVGQGEQRDSQARDKHSFAIKPFWQKFLVMFGGILFNFMFAYTAFTILFMTGIPKTKLLYSSHAIPIISYIKEGSAADKYGLKIGDRIIKINDNKIENNIKVVLDTLLPLANQKASIQIERGEKKKTISLTVGERKEGEKSIGILGVDFDVEEIPPLGFIAAIKEGIKTTHLWIKNTFNAFSHIISKKDVSGVAGPVMIIAMTVKGAAAGLKIFLIFLAIISINLGVLNLIPLPILDGGQILFHLIEAIIRRPLPDKIREYIHIVTWVGFMILFVYLSTQDILRVIKPYLTSILQYFKSA